MLRDVLSINGTMVFFCRGMAVGLLCVLAACAGSSRPSVPLRYPPAAAQQTQPKSILQCVPYARAHSAVKLAGDAYTWWDKAKGRYARRTAPRKGAVMVLYQYAGPSRAHVAVVRSVNRHEIRIDHANWLNDGQIYLDDPVRDISEDLDWSQVNVFNLQTGHWGTRAYAVQGFIGPDGPTEEEDLSSPALVSEWLRRDHYRVLADLADAGN